MQAHRYLMQYSIRPSVQRTAVMEYLMNHKTHPTVDEIYLALSPGIPTLSKTTVYNTLNLFIEKGAVQMLTIDEKNARYDADTSKHAHFYCGTCGKVHDIMNVNPEVFEIPSNSQFTIHSMQLSYYGTCTSCNS
ncbi:MAG: transcriptional repressor [Bacteroidales bacterium]|nr:transcriptional repressor [Bacteroidales bacterium]ODT54837.1 MAG: transcriptional repressor [Paludibacter sp. SCN 50-10]OJX88613.1 MAG: transcriptional repressor [Paludibacter sp. 47-17]